MGTASLITPSARHMDISWERLVTITTQVICDYYNGFSCTVHDTGKAALWQPPLMHAVAALITRYGFSSTH